MLTVNGMPRCPESWQTLSASKPNIPVVLSGDANVQPAVLGAGPDKKLQRDLRVQTLLQEYGLTLRNPLVQEGNIFPIHLPKRDAMVEISPGHTHHFHIGSSRAIDLVFASHQIGCDVRIHNGLHCRELGCAWDLCVEYTLGDHFLIDFSLPEVQICSYIEACEKPPRGWADEERWRCGFSLTKGCWDSFNQILEPVCCLIESLPATKKPSKTVSEWLANACACILATLEGLVRDGWVLAAQVPTRKKRRAEEIQRSVTTTWHDVIEENSWDLLQHDKFKEPAAETALSTCLKWLRPTIPSAPRQLCDPHSKDILTIESSHQQWIQTIHKQFEVPAGWDQNLHQTVERQAAGILGMERRAIGRDVADISISQVDWVQAVNMWDASQAITPDLLPRCIFDHTSEGWSETAWLCTRLCGPCCLAVRPEIWRWKRLTALYKRGDFESASSYRLITVMQQHGLLQENLAFTRVKPRLLGAISCFQSGFMRDVSDPHFCFIELCYVFLARKQPLFAFFADLVKAFPRSWRAFLVKALHESGGLRGGIMSLFHSMLRSDEWLVPLSGVSWETISCGVPEGCRIGPPLFNFLPDTLVTMLIEEGCGVSWTRPMPEPWVSHSWKGTGSPIPDLTCNILQALRNNLPLPPAVLLEADEDIEASALRALDLWDSSGIPVILHADDPLFLASSKGEMRRMLRIISAWSRKYKASLHVSSVKSVIMIIANSEASARVESQTTFMYQAYDMPHPAPLQYVRAHRWLGMMWDNEASFNRHAIGLLAAQQSKVAVIAGLVASGVLPLPMALLIFDLKVMSCLRFGRWLWGISQRAQASLSAALATWAKTILGADPWRNSAVVTGELGWQFSGGALCVLDIASRRAKLWQAQNIVLCKFLFVDGQIQENSRTVGFA